jgi:hypothetical protein
MKTTLRDHTVIVSKCDWRNAFVAHSDNLGEDCSPYGEGKTEQAAIDDLDWQLEELEEKKGKANEAR